MKIFSQFFLITIASNIDRHYPPTHHPLSRHTRKYSMQNNKNSVCKKTVSYYAKTEFVNEIICKNEIYSQMLFKNVSFYFDLKK